MEWKQYIINYLKGLFMGSADIIPGVSGGTIALITGIYTRLIHAISYIVSFLRPSTFTDGYGNLKKKIFGVDYSLLVPLVLGIITAFIVLAGLISYMIESHKALTYAFFFGLISASAIVLWRHMGNKSTSWAFLVIGAAVGLFLTGLTGTMASSSLAYLFISGAIAITAMILPGISGSFILLLMGQYDRVLEIIHSLDLLRMAIFGAGAAIGLALFSKVLDFLLEEYREITMSFLVGLMLGSLRLPVEEVIESRIGISWIQVVLAGLLGLLLVFVLEKVSGHDIGKQAQ